jgi:hypothetical protein
MSVNRSEPPRKRRDDGRSSHGEPDTSIPGRSGGAGKSRATSGSGKARSAATSGSMRPPRKAADRAVVPRVGAGRASEVQAIAKDLDTIRSKVDAIAARVAEEPTDPFGAVGEIFADELRALLGDALPDPGAVRRAARLAVAEQAWSQRLGSLLETRDVVDLLAVSKQRVSTLAREHRLIALPQGGRQRFPAWQFAASKPQDRECLATAHRQLVQVGALSPWTAASWFQQDHPELEGRDPVGFLLETGTRTRLLTVAGRDAERLAQ